MFDESTIDSLFDDGVVTPQNIDIMFNILDTVGVSALWVDKDFGQFKFNKSNRLVTHTIDKTSSDIRSYKELINIIYTAHENNHSGKNSLLAAQNWIERLRQLQKKPMVPQEDYETLSILGERFISRRVFLNDGSMLVISFDNTQFQKREGLAKAALRMSKSGVSCYTLETKKAIIESDYLERILTPEELRKVKRHSLVAIVHPDEVKSSIGTFKWSLRSNISLTKNIRIKTEKHGILWFKFTGRMEKDENNVPFQHILSFEDITEELKIQEDLRSLIDESNAKHKKQTDFMAKLSHELKTPMNAVVGIADALLYNETVTDSVREKLELIQSASERLVDMLDETLDHAKLNTEHTMLNLEYIDARKSISNICKLWENQALKKGTIIRFKAAENLPHKIQLDEKRIGQCLNNLLSNAAKFTEYGYIDIVVKAHKTPNKPDKLAIIVRDNGIGMTDEQQGKIFDAYQQADETISSRFGGTGLGMSITKDFITLMDGKITVKSELGKGTIFLILLPLKSEGDDVAVPQITREEPPQLTPPPLQTTQREQAAPTDENKSLVQANSQQANPDDNWQATEALQNIFASTETDANTLKKLNILVVDDNETNHIVLTSILENIVSKMYSAYNGQEALDVLSVEHIDIVLMDIHMPVMDGIEATISIRQNPDLYPDVRIIALTADPQYQQKRLCVNIGMDEAIAKPVKLVDLIETMKKTLVTPVNRLSKAAS